jgi:hypothetical protein
MPLISFGGRLMKNNMNELCNLENKYGLALFRMGLTHLVDIGVRHLTEDNVKEAINQIVAKDKEDKAGGVNSFMTAEFQCEILRCAAELAKFGVWDLFKYIKKHVVLSDD